MRLLGKYRIKFMEYNELSFKKCKFLGRWLRLNLGDICEHCMKPQDLDHLIDNELLTLNLPTTTIVAQPFNIIKWQLKFNPVA